MHLKKLITIVIIVFMAGLLNQSIAQFGQPSSQQKDDFKMQKRLFIGGGLDFGISSYSTVIGVAPIVGYRLSPSFDVGLRLSYLYYHYKDSYYEFNSNSYGAGLFGRYYLFFFNNLFLHGEYEALNYDYYNYPYTSEDKERIWVSSLFVGGGYRQWIGQTAFVGITVLWNLLDDINSPYSNPVFRIGVGVGI
jgi:hypothetical protein